MHRRAFLASLAAAGAARSVILLRSSWQTVNIGDIAHTPGVLAVIEEHPSSRGDPLAGFD